MLVESLLRLQKHDGLPDIVDSASGQVLKGHLVGKARQEEMEYFFGMNVYAKVLENEAWGRTGKRPIGVRWVDVNKGDDDDPNYRSRLVAKDIRKRCEDAIFAPTPPLESLRAVLTLVASPQVRMNRQHSWRGDDRFQVSFVDISRAYFNAKTDPDKPVYVELPREDPDWGKGLRVRLNVHIYIYMAHARLRTGGIVSTRT